MNHNSPYDPNWVAAHYDEYGEQEWERFFRSPVDEVNLLIHTHYLEQFVQPGSRILEVGAGPGRFTRIMAGSDCRIVVADISPVQLDLHRQHARELAFEKAVEDRLQLDVCDMSVLCDDSFDAVVCYGGPLSYVFDRAPVALRECARVCRGGGHVLASVMSLWGTAHRFLQGVLDIPPGSNRKITDSGDLTPENWEGIKHRCHMFRSSELRQMIRQAGLTVVALSASNGLSIGWEELLAGAKEQPEKWRELLRMELEACREEGCLDMGTHIIGVGRKE